MKKRGFTLIELLAVIVVLAIIALIATPIVMNLIKNAEKGAAERSAERYIDAVELAIATDRLDNALIADGVYESDANGNLCLQGKTCTEPDLTVEINGNKPKTGTTVKIVNGQVVAETDTRINFEDYTVSYNEQKELVATEIVPTAPSCTIVSGNKNTVGSEVECGGERFYIIPQDTTNHVADSTTISLLAKYNLNVGTNKVADDEEGIQSANATAVLVQDPNGGPPVAYGGVKFSEKDTRQQEFWAGKVTEFPAYVYGEESPTYEYVNDYKGYLEEQGVNNIKEAILISYEQANNIKDNYSNPSWLYTSNYWTGTAYSSSDAAGNGWGAAYYVTSSGMSGNMATYPTGVRPVIVIDADEI